MATETDALARAGSALAPLPAADAPHCWAIVLAAGSGTRLQGLTRDGSGAAVPKQFCSLDGGRSLLWDALERARRIAPLERIVAVVAAQHRRWWERELEPLPRENVLVQPENRGTAGGILLPLLSILERDPAARLALLPSDHFVRRERVLAAALRAALDELGDGRITLLGITPDGPETDYGWIVPAAGDPPARVEAFVEKPCPADAQACWRRGGAWNSFLIAAEGGRLRELFARRVPVLLERFERAFRSGARDRTRALAELYARLGSLDFSRAVLQGSEPFLRLRVVPACGWTDLGTPERVARCLEDLRARDSRAGERRSHAALDLGAALGRSPEPQAHEPVHAQ